MADLTSAQRLAAYRDELRDAGFGEDQVAHLVGVAAPRIEDVEVQADLDVEPTSIGEVRVRLKPHTDTEDLRRVADQVEATVRAAAVLNPPA